jgi:uncharacterized protein involved in exopolysaccharide biosynthesis
MNTPLKFDHEKRPNFQFEHPDSRTYYEDLASRTLRSIIRHRRLIALAVALSFAFACITIPMLPRKYTAQALIYPDLFSRDQGKVTALASVDANAIVTGEARLIHSDAFLRAVVRRLGEDAPKPHSWPAILEWVRAILLPETRNHSEFDRTVAMLRNKVVIMNDTRSYLISISFTGASPEEAARIVDSFAIEYAHEKAAQRRVDRVNFAEFELQRQRTVYGDKHPKTLQALEERDAARAAANLQVNARDEPGDGQSIQLAEPDQTPTSPNGFVILVLSLLSGLLVGVGLAIWLDHKESRQTQKVVSPSHPL